MADTQDVKIQVRFTIGDYSDALYYTQEEYAKLTLADIEAAKQARYDNWKATVAEMSSRVPVPPTPEEVQAQIDALTQQQRDTQDQLLLLAPGDVMLSILQQQAQIIADQISALEK